MFQAIFIEYERSNRAVHVKSSFYQRNIAESDISANIDKIIPFFQRMRSFVNLQFLYPTRDGGKNHQKTLLSLRSFPYDKDSYLLMGDGCYEKND